MVPLRKPYIKRRELDGVLTALVNEQITPGATVHKLENELREFMKADACIALSSHFTALNLWKNLYQDELTSVTLSPFTAGSLFYFLTQFGIAHKFTDFCPGTPLIDPEPLAPAEALGEWVHLTHHLGYIPETDSFRKKSYRILQDVTESFASYRDLQLAGSDGDAAILRLDSGGWMNAGGGCLLFVYGKKKAAELKVLQTSLPADLRLSDMNAALALVQWQDREKIFRAKKEAFSHMAMRLTRSAGKLPHQDGDVEQIMPCLPVLVERGVQDVLQYAEKRGVEAALAFPPESLMTDLSSYPHARGFHLRCLLFPLYPSLTSKDAETLGKVLSTLP